MSAQRSFIVVLCLALLAASVASGQSPSDAARKAKRLAVALNQRVASPRRADSDTAAEMRAACPPVAFIRRERYGMRGTNAVMFSQVTDSGSAICVYDPARPHEEAKTLFKTELGFVFNMNVSFDGKRLVFSYKETPDAPFHLWEIHTDGTGLRQLTAGPYHDFSPVYYPDGRIVFTSSRVESYSLCQNYLACALHIIDGDGSNLRRIDYTTLCTLTPAILQDGSILCTRWEYQDKNIFGWEGLWTMHPNGRQLKLYHGNTFRIPNAVYGGRQIPGTSRVMVVWAAHHRPPVGDLAIIDRSKGIESWDSMWKVTHVTPVEKDLASGEDWRKTGTGGKVADTYFHRAYADPYPFSKDLTLVSFGGDHPDFHHLYILNHNTGETCLLYRTESSCFSPVPLQSVGRPVAIPGDCPQQAGEGTCLVYDVYAGLEEQGVRRGQVKALRVMSQQPKKFNTEGLRFNDHYPIVGQGSYYVKVNHGTVPVAADGSAFFRAPSNTELYFIALDGCGKEIQRMGSVLQITSGETRSCVGCHDDRLKAPPRLSKQGLPAHRRPVSITAPPWGAGPVDFVKQVQPILNRYCVACHEGPEAEQDVDLTGDKTRFYNMAYESLVYGGYVDYFYINQGPNGVFPAMATGSWVSRITELIEMGHGDITMDDASRRCFYAWIDANVPYYGTWDMSRPHTIGGRDAYARTRPGMGPVWSDQRKGSDLSQFEAWVARFDVLAAQCGRHVRPIARGGSNGFNERGRINLTRPAWSPVLLQNLAQSAGGRAENETAPFQSKDDPRYREMLAILQEAKHRLDATPRMDMSGAIPISQERDFGRTFEAP